MARAAAPADDLRVVWLGRVEYLDGWERQKALHAQVAAGEAPATVLLLEHDPVYTAGKRTQPLDRPVGDPGAPVVDVDRGGRITWHGPGQLTGYPLLRLAPLPGSTGRDGLVDVVAHVRRMEDALVEVCAAFDVAAGRVAGRSGVWVPADDRGPDRKVAAIGVRVARGTTLHGFALNCDNDLSWFDRIVPCGIRDASVTTLSAETGRTVTIGDALPVVETALRRALVPALPPRPAAVR